MLRLWGENYETRRNSGGSVQLNVKIYTVNWHQHSCSDRSWWRVQGLFGSRQLGDRGKRHRVRANPTARAT